MLGIARLRGKEEAELPLAEEMSERGFLSFQQFELSREHMQRPLYRLFVPVAALQHRGQLVCAPDLALRCLLAATAPCSASLRDGSSSLHWKSSFLENIERSDSSLGTSRSACHDFKLKYQTSKRALVPHPPAE